MAMRVDVTFVFTEEEFEQLSFDKQGDIVDNLFKHKDWDIEILKAEFMECNMDSDYNENDEEDE